MIELALIAAGFFAGFIIGYIVCAIYLGERIEELEQVIIYQDAQRKTQKRKQQMVEVADERNFITGKLNWTKTTTSS